MIAGRRDPPIQVEAECLLGDPPWRHERLHRQIDPQLLLLREGLALHLGHRLLKDPAIRVEPDGRDVPVLFGAEEVPGAPYLQVPHGHLESRPQGGEPADGLQPVVGLLGQRRLRREEQIGEGPVGAPTDPSS